MHTSKINVLPSSLNSREVLRVSCTYIKRKPKYQRDLQAQVLVFFRFSLQATFIFKVKMKVAQNVKVKKLLGFSFYINMGGSEAFL